MFGGWPLTLAKLHILPWSNILYAGAMDHNRIFQKEQHISPSHLLYELNPFYLSMCVVTKCLKVFIENVIDKKVGVYAISANCGKD